MSGNRRRAAQLCYKLLRSKKFCVRSYLFVSDRSTFFMHYPYPKLNLTILCNNLNRERWYAARFSQELARATTTAMVMPFFCLVLALCFSCFVLFIASLACLVWSDLLAASVARQLVLVV